MTHSCVCVCVCMCVCVNAILTRVYFTRKKKSSRSPGCTKKVHTHFSTNEKQLLFPTSTVRGVAIPRVETSPSSSSRP
uniref:Putative secreted protein n=1 Tax=Anopheles darlingi TaxID=43151 RepID=A0A2M4DF55_ANODA